MSDSIRKIINTFDCAVVSPVMCRPYSPQYMEQEEEWEGGEGGRGRRDREMKQEVLERKFWSFGQWVLSPMVSIVSLSNRSEREKVKWRNGK